MNYRRIDVNGTNCYIIFSEEENSVLLIDPAFEPKAVAALFPGKKAVKTILTHGHIDHIYDCMYFGAPVYIGQADAEHLTDRRLNAPYGIFPELEVRNYPVAGLLKDGQTVDFCEYSFEVIHTPGHTPGHICLYGHGTLFCGDLLFRGSVGRTDFPEGSDVDMAHSLKRIIKLPPQTLVCPGHGPETTLEAELRENMYIDYFTRRDFQ